MILLLQASYDIKSVAVGPLGFCCFVVMLFSAAMEFQSGIVVVGAFGDTFEHDKQQKICTFGDFLRWMFGCYGFLSG